MNGIICMNKPEGFTSFDVIAKMRGILRTKKLGHAGTLDPMATGVLPVFVGTATKACDILPNHDKTYEAGFKLGVITDTQDSGGAVLEENPAEISREMLLEALPRFRGEIMQIPPMYSAVSVNGQRLYDLARKGIEVEREPRPITVYTLELLEYNAEERTGRLKISCSKGTYIRTVIHDLGKALGVGGIMTALVRTEAAGFTLNDCVGFAELEALREAGDFSSVILPIEKVFRELPAINLNEVQARMYKNGIKLDLNRVRLPEKAPRYRVYGGGEFLGTAKPDCDAGILRIEKNFYNR